MLCIPATLPSHPLIIVVHFVKRVLLTVYYYFLLTYLEGTIRCKVYKDNTSIDTSIVIGYISTQTITHYIKSNNYIEDANRKSYFRYLKIHEGGKGI